MNQKYDKKKRIVRTQRLLTYFLVIFLYVDWLIKEILCNIDYLLSAVHQTLIWNGRILRQHLKAILCIFINQLLFFLQSICLYLLYKLNRSANRFFPSSSSMTQKQHEMHLRLYFVSCKRIPPAFFVLSYNDGDMKTTSTFYANLKINLGNNTSNDWDELLNTLYSRNFRRRITDHLLSF